MPHKRSLTLTDAQRQALRDARDHDARPHVRERCAALLKIAAGHSAHWVAMVGGLKRRQADTIYKWLNDYEAEGIQGMIDHQQGGNRRRSV